MVKGRGMKGRGMKGRGMKGRGTLQGGEPRRRSWVVLHPHCHLHACCHCLAACRHCMSWSCRHGAASSSSVIVPCHCRPCPGCIVVVPCHHAVCEQGGLGRTEGGTYCGALTMTTNDDSWSSFIVSLPRH